MSLTQDTKTKNSSTSVTQPQDDFMSSPVISTDQSQTTVTDSPVMSMIGSAYDEQSTTSGSDAPNNPKKATKTPEEMAMEKLGISADVSNPSLLAKISDSERERLDAYARSEIDFVLEGLTKEVNATEDVTQAQRITMNYLLMRKEALKSNVKTKDMSGNASYKKQLVERGTTSSTTRTVESGTRSATEFAESTQRGEAMWEDSSGAIHTHESADNLQLHESVSKDNATHSLALSEHDEENNTVRKETNVTVTKEDRRAALERKKVEDSKKKLRDQIEVNATIAEASTQWDSGIGAEGETDKADLGGGVSAQAAGEVSTLKANAKGGIYYDPKKGVKIGGSAGAKYTLAGGNAKLTAGPYGFNLGGEKMRSEFTLGVSAGVLAEVNGQLDVNVSKGSKSVGVELDTPAGAGSEGKLAAFAGAKAGIEAGAKLDWGKKPDYRFSVESYTRKLIRDYLGSYSEYVPDFMFNEFATHFASVVIGQGGWKNLAAVKGGVEGSAGIGGEASYNLGLSGGRIKCSGALKGTVGLGVGGKVSLDLDALDGVRFLGLMLFKAADSLLKAFGIAPAQIQARIRKKSQEAMRWLGKQIYDYGTSGSVDYLIPDSAAAYCANALGYSI